MLLTFISKKSAIFAPTNRESSIAMFPKCGKNGRLPHIVKAKASVFDFICEYGKF